MAQKAQQTQAVQEAQRKEALARAPTPVVSAAAAAADIVAPLENNRKLRSTPLFALRIAFVLFLFFGLVFVLHPSPSFAFRFLLFQWWSVVTYI